MKTDILKLLNTQTLFESQLIRKLITEFGYIRKDFEASLYCFQDEELIRGLKIPTDVISSLKKSIIIDYYCQEELTSSSYRYSLKFSRLE